MKIIGTKKLNLIPIGNVKISFRKHKDRLYVGSLNIKNETRIDVDGETYIALLRLMKNGNSEVLTDGYNFFTTTGDSITQIEHPSFRDMLTENDEIKAQIFQLCYGNGE